MEVGGLDPDLGQFRIRDLDPGGVLLPVEPRLDLQPRGGCCAADQIDDRFMADQRTATPVLRNEGKHPVFNLVPLACSRREMTNVNSTGWPRLPSEPFLRQPELHFACAEDCG